MLELPQAPQAERAMPAEWLGERDLSVTRRATLSQPGGKGMAGQVSGCGIPDRHMQSRSASTTHGVVPKAAASVGAFDSARKGEAGRIPSDPIRPGLATRTRTSEQERKKRVGWGLYIWTSKDENATRKQRDIARRKTERVM